MRTYIHYAFTVPKLEGIIVTIDKSIPSYLRVGDTFIVNKSTEHQLIGIPFVDGDQSKIHYQAIWISGTAKKGDYIDFYNTKEC